MGTVFHIEDTLSTVAPCCSRPSMSTTRQKVTIQFFHWLSCARRSDASGRTERRHGKGAVAWRPAESRTGEPAVARSGPASSAGLAPSGASWWQCTSASPAVWRHLERRSARRWSVRGRRQAEENSMDKAMRGPCRTRSSVEGAAGCAMARSLVSFPHPARCNPAGPDRMVPAPSPTRKYLLARLSLLCALLAGLVVLIPPATVSAGQAEGEVFRDCDGTWCPEMVVVPAGSFMMGTR